MTRTDEFAKNLKVAIEGGCSELGAWECSWLLAKGHEAVDVVGAPIGRRRCLVLIEVELRRGAPVVNVAKIWKWVKANPGREVVLVQAFSAFYSKTDPRKNNAVFIGERMAEATGAKYVPISFGYHPRKYGRVGAGRRRLHAQLLAKKIIKKLKLRKSQSVARTSSRVQSGKDVVSVDWHMDSGGNADWMKKVPKRGSAAVGA